MSSWPVSSWPGSEPTRGDCAWVRGESDRLVLFYGFSYLQSIFILNLHLVRTTKAMA